MSPQRASSSMGYSPLCCEQGGGSSRKWLGEPARSGKGKVGVLIRLMVVERRGEQSR